MALLWPTLLGFFVPIYVISQNYPTHKYTMRDGLPGMDIHCIYKDSRGLIWIGTETGLCSFDGKSFRIFKPSEGMTASQVWAIAEDNAGNLWFGSNGEGVFRFDGNKFSQYTTNNGLADNRTRVMCWSEKYQCIIAGGYDGISRIKNDTVKAFPENPLERASFTLATGITDAGDFVYVTTFGTDNPYRFYPGRNKLVSVSDNNRYPANSFSVFIASNGDTIFSSGHYGIKILKTDGTSEYLENMGQVFAISEDNTGNIWFASWSTTNRDMIEGVFKYDGHSVTNYKQAFGIVDKEIWTVYFDHEQHILWIGTLGEGLFCVPFSAFTNYPPIYFGLKENKIDRVYLDSKNRLWILGNRELIQMNSGEKFSIFDKSAALQVLNNFWTENRKKKINQDFLNLIEPANFNETEKEIYIGNTPFNFSEITEVGDDSMVYINHLGTFLYSGKYNTTKYLNMEGYGANLVAYGDTLVYAGASTFFHTGFKNSRMEEHLSTHLMNDAFQQFSPNYEPLNVTRVRRFGNRTWYTSSATGLWMSEGTNLVNLNKNDSTISNSLNDICQDDREQLIFGSNTGEIYIAVFNGDSLKIVHRINDSKGLWGNSINWLVAGTHGKLWVGTNLGLNCIDLDSLYLSGKYLIRFIDEEDGFTGQSARHAVIDSSGNLWLGIIDCLIRFDSHEFLASKTEPGRLLIKTIEINNTAIDSFPHLELNPWLQIPEEGFKLRYNENNLSFYFNKLNYRNPGKARFRYRLIGYNDRWTNWSESKRAVFTNLSPGKYRLCVESNNLYNPAHVESLEYSFSIQPPWWGIWYLQAIFALSVVLVVLYSIRRYYEKKRKNQLVKAEIGKKLAELEMQALQAQMNPHFIFNSINGIQSFVLAGDMDGVLGYLSDFSKIVRFSLENATKKQVSLEQKIEFLHSYIRLEQMRFPDKFDYEIQTKNIDAAVLFIPPMIIQPFVENTIRHGFMNIKHKGHLVIRFEEIGDDVIKCIITDNGGGRQKIAQNSDRRDKDKRLHSTEITETRIRLFNTPGSPEKYRVVYTDLYENDQPRGLMVEIYLPKSL